MTAPRPNIKKSVRIEITAARTPTSALYAFIPEVVPEDQLTKVNSVIATSSQLAYLVGPAIAGYFFG